MADRADEEQNRQSFDGLVLLLEDMRDTQNFHSNQSLEDLAKIETNLRDIQQQNRSAEQTLKSIANVLWCIFMVLLYFVWKTWNAY